MEPSTVSGESEAHVVAAGQRVALTRLRAVLKAVWVEHRLVVLVGSVYLLAGGALLTWRERPWHLYLWYPLVWETWAYVSGVWLIVQYMRHPKLARRILTPERVLGAVLVIGVVAPIQSTFQSLKRAIPTFTWDPWLSDLDIALHGGLPWELWIPSTAVLRLIDHCYVLWFVSVILFLVWVSWTSHRQLRSRILLSTLLLWMVGGTAVAWSLSSAGPCYYGLVVEGPDTYAELSARIKGLPVAAKLAQAALWDARQTGLFTPISGISAMPSMHVAMAVLIALVVWQRSRWVGAVCWLYAAVIQIGSVVLAWHYAIDGYVGGLLALGCWTAASSVRVSIDSAIVPAAERVRAAVDAHRLGRTKG